VRGLDGLTHYDLLDVSRDADTLEVERAYAMARATYADDSLATYSIYDEESVRELRDRIELAYRVLADPEARRHYDATLARAPGSPRTPSIEVRLADEPQPPRPELRPEVEGFEDPDDEADSAEFSGARLRRARLRRGLELQQIAEITKITPRYLHYLEEEYFSGLPAPVYVRGFVTGYARCVGLDPKRVAGSYMQRFLMWSERGHG
jgi:curved DNA-binding protein CbpA